MLHAQLKILAAPQKHDLRGERRWCRIQLTFRDILRLLARTINARENISLDFLAHAVKTRPQIMKRWPHFLITVPLVVRKKLMSFKKVLHSQHARTIIPWREKTFNVPSGHIKCEFVDFVCAHGPLSIIQWYVKRLGISAEDIRSRNHAAVLSACRNDGPEVIKFLVKEFGLTAADMYTAEKETTLLTACANGRLETAKWIQEEFPHRIRQIGVVIMFVSQRGHPHITEWLREQNGQFI